MLELDDIQGTVLRNRPLPYFGAYLLFRIDAREQARMLVERLLPSITSALDWANPVDKAWLNVIFTHAGLRRMGVPAEILAGFPIEFRMGMAARKDYLGDTGASDPSLWDTYLGRPEFHVGLFLMAQDHAGLQRKLALGRAALRGITGVHLLEHLDVGIPETMREHFGFVDGISRLFVEGQGGEPLPGQEVIRAGEFVLGYVNETERVARGPGPEAFWRNGTFLSIRKLYQDVAGFRRFLRERARTPDAEEMLAAKMVGRFRSGCPLALSPDRDDPALGKDASRNNAFGYASDDPRGLKTPAGSHIRRVNPRDSLKDSIVNARLHKIIRRGSAFGPALRAGAMEDDGAPRGVVLAFVNADPGRQFEFVQSQWVNDGDFIASGRDRDPLVGNHDGSGELTYPARPVRQHLTGLPSFVRTRGGEHVFLPGLRGLRWICALP
jgi:deferrochelatase/peroxidase EfeB